jgi:mannose-binding lectin
MNWSPAYPLSFIPIGNLVTFSALHQAANVQYVQILDSNNNPISFKTLTGQQAQFPIQGQGTQAGFFTNGAGSFTMQAGYKVQFANSGPSVSLVANTNPNVFYINGQVYGGGIFFCTEDQGGTDYNDTSLSIEWYTYAG